MYNFSNNDSETENSDIKTSTLARQHVSAQYTLAREHINTQGTLACEYVSTQGTLAREHSFSTQVRQFSRVVVKKGCNEK